MLSKSEYQALGPWELLLLLLNGIKTQLSGLAGAKIILGLTFISLVFLKHSVLSLPGPVVGTTPAAAEYWAPPRCPLPLLRTAAGTHPFPRAGSPSSCRWRSPAKTIHSSSCTRSDLTRQQARVQKTSLRKKACRNEKNEMSTGGERGKKDSYIVRPSSSKLLPSGGDVVSFYDSTAAVAAASPDVYRDTRAEKNN